MGSSEYKLIARQSLRGQWLMALLVTLVGVLLGADIGGGGGGRSSSGGGDLCEWFRYSSSTGFFSPEMIWALLATMVSFAAIVYFLVSFVIGGAVEQGLCLYNTRLIHRMEQQPFRTLFERFDIFIKALGLRFVTGVFTFLWSLLFVIPGIVAAYRYAMAPYLMAHYPEMDIMQAIEESKKLMYGHKAELFVLHLSFIGWIILASFTFGIGYLWLNPYMKAAEAAFYLDRVNQLPNFQQSF